MDTAAPDIEPEDFVIVSVQCCSTHPGVDKMTGDFAEPSLLRSSAGSEENGGARRRESHAADRANPGIDQMQTAVIDFMNELSRAHS